MKNNNERLFVDMHAIQIVPPSNLNRDDTGSPKTAQYGGVKRARVSSQSWKRAMREYFLGTIGTENLGKRTLRLPEYIADNIKKQIPEINDQDALIMAENLINQCGIQKNGKLNKVFPLDKNKKIESFIFISNAQIEALAKKAIALDDELKKDPKYSIKYDDVREVIKAFPSIDIALFGRMLAKDPLLNEDASSQVAHAISTHGVQTEFDFYTAVDDLAPDDNAGAGMLGTIEFNSSTLYRYANVAIHEFANQIKNKEDVIKAIKLYVKAFANSMPTGKINTFANQTLPQFVMVTLRKDRPVNLISAFEEPVKYSNGYTKASIEKLIKESKKIEKFVEKPALQLFVAFDDLGDFEIAGKEEKNLDALNEDLGKYLNEELGKDLSD